MIPSPSEIWVGSHWHFIPTKFLPFLPFRSDSAQNLLGSAQNAWGRVKYSKIALMRSTRTQMLIIRYLKYDHHFTHLPTLFQAKARLCDLRNCLKNRGNQVVLEDFWNWVGDNEEAMKDQDKRITFGKEYCSSEWKFVWKAYDKEVSTHTLWNHYWHSW